MKSITYTHEELEAMLPCLRNDLAQATVARKNYLIEAARYERMVLFYETHIAAIERALREAQDG